MKRKRKRTLNLSRILVYLYYCTSTFSISNKQFTLIDDQTMQSSSSISITLRPNLVQLFPLYNPYIQCMSESFSTMDHMLLLSLYHQSSFFLSSSNARDNSRRRENRKDKLRRVTGVIVTSIFLSNNISYVSKLESQNERKRRERERE